MPLYSFIDQHGLEHEVSFGMDDVPDVGSTINRDDLQLTRTFSMQSGIVREYRSVNHGLPRVDPKSPWWPKFNDKGQPVTTNKRDVRQLESITGWKFT